MKSTISCASGKGKRYPQNSVTSSCGTETPKPYHTNAVTASTSKSHMNAQIANVAPMNTDRRAKGPSSLQTLQAPHPASANRSSPPMRKGVMKPAGPQGLTTLQTASETTATAAPVRKPYTNATMNTMMSISLKFTKPASAKSEPTTSAEKTATAATSERRTLVGLSSHQFKRSCVSKRTG